MIISVGCFMRLFYMYNIIHNMIYIYVEYPQLHVRYKALTVQFLGCTSIGTYISQVLQPPEGQLNAEDQCRSINQLSICKKEMTKAKAWFNPQDKWQI